MNYIYESHCFDLKQIADSGQCFRMKPIMTDTLASHMPLTFENTSAAYEIISCGRRLIVSQEGCRIAFDCPEEDLDFWKSYFDCGQDYEAVIASINPEDPWEMIITFVISQQKTIPNIRAL